VQVEGAFEVVEERDLLEVLDLELGCDGAVEGDLLELLLVVPEPLQRLLSGVALAPLVGLRVDLLFVLVEDAVAEGIGRADEFVVGGDLVFELAARLGELLVRLLDELLDARDHLRARLDELVELLLQRLASFLELLDQFRLLLRLRLVQLECHGASGIRLS
jgi:hypothetical protein